MSNEWPRARLTVRGRIVYSAKIGWTISEGYINEASAVTWNKKGGPCLVVPDRHEPPVYAYQDELQSHPKLKAAMDNYGVNHVCEAAGVTASERDALLLRAAGRSWGEIAQAFMDVSFGRISRGAVQSYANRGRAKLISAYINGATVTGL
jgi:hypothetical protein